MLTSPFAHSELSRRVSQRELGYTVIGWLSDCSYRVGTATVRGLRDNIRHAMGALGRAGQVDEATRRAYRALLWNYFDLVRLPSTDD